MVTIFPDTLISSIFFIKKIEHLPLPLWLLLITPMIVVLAIPIAYYLFVKNKELPNQIVQSNRPLYNFLVNKWYFDELYDIIFIQSSKKIGLFFCIFVVRDCPSRGREWWIFKNN